MHRGRLVVLDVVTLREVRGLLRVVVVLVDAELRLRVGFRAMGLVQLVEGVVLLTRLVVAVVDVVASVAGVEVAHGVSPSLLSDCDTTDVTDCVAFRNPPNVPRVTSCQPTGGRHPGSRARIHA
ncbi:hypothetical protein GCM10017581_066760 [Dactylosporangium matsuzakiense]|uniref:Uncharacterized protein n=1 Tax=Dactylosporangium matsuzakiense TaxID=53360 RepID=A0A9W6KSX1_9ACTN|nr:hypothetical protein GCM10017581_066760 [Dactylosporangium matsuzakiense]